MVDNPSHQLKVLRDPTGKKVAERLFDTYVSGKKKDYTRAAEFMIALDRLVSEFGGLPLPDEDETEDSRRGRHDESYDDDDDLHAEESSVDQVKAAMKKVLRKL